MEQFLEDFSAYIRENQINIFRFSVIRGQEAPVTREITACNPCQDVYSCAKMFTLTALGMLWDEGKLDLDLPVTQILGSDCPENTDPKWHRITVDMVIRHHCGLPGGYLDIDCQPMAEFGEDFLATLLTYPISEPESYVYSDGAYYLLARIAAKLAGTGLVEYLWKNLFSPLGFREAAWSTCPKGYVMGATGLYLRSEDLVKLGAVYLNRGVYQGKRIFSQAWAELVTSRGYLHRVGSRGAFGHGGMCGQMVLVLPESNMAVAWQGFSRENPKVWVSEYF